MKRDAETTKGGNARGGAKVVVTFLVKAVTGSFVCTGESLDDSLFSLGRKARRQRRRTGWTAVSAACFASGLAFVSVLFGTTVGVACTPSLAATPDSMASENSEVSFISGWIGRYKEPARLPKASKRQAELLCCGGYGPDR